MKEENSKKSKQKNKSMKQPHLVERPDPVQDLSGRIPSHLYSIFTPHTMSGEDIGLMAFNQGFQNGCNFPLRNPFFPVLTCPFKGNNSAASFFPETKKRGTGNLTAFFPFQAPKYPSPIGEPSSSISGSISLIRRGERQEQKDKSKNEEGNALPGKKTDGSRPRAKDSDSSYEDPGDMDSLIDILGREAYGRRNVYKSILRHMFSFIRRNKRYIVEILKNEGFLESSIEHVFYQIGKFSDGECESGARKNTQSKVRKMISKRSEFSIVLRETLKNMIQDYNQGNLGKLSKRNLDIYRDVCQRLYEETVKITTFPSNDRIPHS